MASGILEEAWVASIKVLPGEPRPKIVQVSKDAASQAQFIADLARVSKKATYAVVPVMVVGMDGIQRGDEVRVVTETARQTATGHVMDIREGLAKVRYGASGGTVEIPAEHLEVVSRWVKFRRPEGRG